MKNAFDEIKEKVFEQDLQAIGFNKTTDDKYMLLVMGEYSYIFAYYDSQEGKYKLRGALTFPKQYNTVPLDDDFSSEPEILQRIVDLTTKLSVV